jgi:hypothetical protein
MRMRAQRGQPATLRGLVALAAVALSPLDAPAARSADEVFISIGTGALDGLYYALGKTICEIVNRGRAEHGIRCSAEPTLGSSITWSVWQPESSTSPSYSPTHNTMPTMEVGLGRVSRFHS